MLYGPSGDDNLYDLVVQGTSQCISVFRTSDLNEAESRFDIYKSVIPPFLDANGDLCSTSQLQKLCDTARSRPDWSLAHIAVQLDHNDLIRQVRFVDVISTPDKNGVSPLMLAVLSGNKNIIWAVLDAGADVSTIDKDGNNVFHIAANTSGKIIEYLSGGGRSDASPSKDRRESVRFSGGKISLQDGDTYLNKIPKLLNHRNSSGLTPLHIACKEDKADCVKALLCAGSGLNVMVNDSQEIGESGTGQKVKDLMMQFPNQIYVKDFKNGGTPLHWMTDKPLLEGMLELGCVIDAPNFDGNTALHLMVRYKRLPCVVSLLSHGASVDLLDAEGNSALHLAIETGHVSTIEALLVFGANYNMKNKKGENPWCITLRTFQSSFTTIGYDQKKDQILHSLQAIGAHGPTDLSPGAKDYEWKPHKSKTKTEEDVNKRCRHLLDEFLEKSAFNSKDINRKGVRVLSLDGGGIRGLVLIKMLSVLNEHLKFPITQSFDWIAGTSTGGILALALAYGISPMECQGLYFRLKDKVFVGKRPYDVAPLEDFLKKQFTEEAKMSDLPNKPKVAVTGVLADRFPPDLHLFTNYHSPMEVLGLQDDLLPGMSPRKKSDEQPIWRAARSSGAAPTYFRASGRFIDGGLIGNNPTLDIMTEIQERNAALKAVGREDEVEQLGVVVSLGTGETPVVKIDSIDLFRPDSMLGVGQMMSGISAMGNLGKILVEQASSSSNRVVDRARAMCGWIGVPYIRLSPQLDVDIVLDEVRDEVLVHMLWITQAYMHQQRNNLVQLAGILTKGQTIYCNK